MTNTPVADISRANDLIGQALAASPRSTPAHIAKVQLLRAEGRCDEAIPELETVIASNRNSPGALFALGHCKLTTGSIDEVIPLEEQAIRLGPRDPYVFNRYLVIGEVHLLQSRTEEAIVWLEKARIGNPGSPWPHVWLAAAYGLKGDLGRAAAELAEARRLLGGRAYSSIAAMRTGNWGVPSIRALQKPLFSRVCARPGSQRNDHNPPSDPGGDEIGSISAALSNWWVWPDAIARNQGEARRPRPLAQPPRAEPPP